MATINAVMTQVQAGINSTWSPMQDFTKIGTVSRGHNLPAGDSGAGGVVGDGGGFGAMLPSPATLTAHSGKLGGSSVGDAVVFDEELVVGDVSGSDGFFGVSPTIITGESCPDSAITARGVSANKTERNIRCMNFLYQSRAFK